MAGEKRTGFIIRALLLDYLVTVTGLILLSVGIWKFQIGDKIVNAAMTVLYFLSVFTGSIYLGRKVKERKFLWGMLQGTLYFLLWVSAVAAANGFVGVLNQNTFTIGIICILSGTLGGMLA